MAYPISSKILEAVQACDDALREPRGALAVETARLNCLFDKVALFIYRETR